MNQVARGEFVVKLLPLGVEGQPEGSKIGRMSIDKAITGDLVATTAGQMLSAMTEVKGSAGYVAIEKVDGALAGKKGTFVLQHTGTMNKGAPTLSVTVVPDSGTGELVGLAGEFAPRRRLELAPAEHAAANMKLDDPVQPLDEPGRRRRVVTEVVHVGRSSSLPDLGVPPGADRLSRLSRHEPPR